MAHVYATFSTWATASTRINRGDLWDDSDPVVQAHPDWFTDDPAAAGLVRHSDTSSKPSHVPVETTTADPDNPRSLTGSTDRRPPKAQRSTTETR